MKLCGGVLLSAWIGLGLGLGTARAEDWNFTRQDYAALRASGKELRFAGDSYWLPQSIRNNVIATLNYVLNPALTPSSSEGVNREDLYHGHIACVPPSTDALKSVRREFFRLEKTPFEKRAIKQIGALPLSEELSLFREAIKELETIYGNYLEMAVRPSHCRDVVVIYHTFEMSAPLDGSIRMGDPRRNILTRVSDQKPTHYAPPDVDNASSWFRDFENIVQFSFLVDQYGAIHATSGLMEHMSRFTGETRKPR